MTRTRIVIGWILSLGLIFATSRLLRAIEVTPLPIGSSCPDFNLPGVDGRQHSLKDFASAKVLVVILTCDHCPTAQAYEHPQDKGRAMEFLKDHHMSSTNFIYTGQDKDALVSSLDPKWEGPVPHTMLIAPGGKVIYRHTGQIDPLEVKKHIVAYLGRTYAPSPGIAGVEGKR